MYFVRVYNIGIKSIYLYDERGSKTSSDLFARIGRDIYQFDTSGISLLTIRCLYNN